MDWHQIQQSKKYCRTILHDLGCKCIHGAFHEVPVMDFFTVFCASLLWMVYLKRKDSEKYYSAKRKDEQMGANQQTIVAEHSVSISQEPASIKESVSYDDSYCRQISAYDTPAGGKFHDNDPEIPRQDCDIDVSHHSSFHHQSVGNAYD